MSTPLQSWTVACQAPLSMGFPRQEGWSGLPFFPPQDLPDPGTKPLSPALAGRLFTTEPPGKPKNSVLMLCLIAYDRARKRGRRALGKVSCGTWTGPREEGTDSWRRFWDVLGEIFCVHPLLHFSSLASPVPEETQRQFI